MVKKVVPALLLLLLSAPAEARLQQVQKLESPDGRWVAVERAGPNADYPARIEVWLRNRSTGRSRMLRAFDRPGKDQRQSAKLEGWTNQGALLVSLEREPNAHMVDDYGGKMESTLWTFPSTGPGQPWTRGSVHGNILSVRGERVCLGLKAERQGGGGMADYVEFKALEVCDLQGHTVRRWDGLELGYHAEVSPDGRWVACDEPQPIADWPNTTTVLSIADGKKRRFEKCSAGEWKGPSSLELLPFEGPRRAVDVSRDQGSLQQSAPVAQG